MSSPAAGPGLLAGRKLVAVDLETTGWNSAGGHAVIEIACVSIDDGVIGATWSSLVRPRRPVPAQAREVHGITDAMLARGLMGPGASALETLRDSLGLEPEPAHRALGDALTTARALLKLAPRWERERGVRTLEALAAASQDAVRLTARRGGFDSGADAVSSERSAAF